MNLAGNPQILFSSDAPDLQAAIERSFYGLFTHKGEKCSASTRLLVQRDVYDQVVDKIATYADRYKCGSPFDPESDQGAQVSKAHMESILKHIENGKKGGCSACNGR
ncbi:aldehyde dehydrogenase family protein [Peribacillus frigoritolerans]|nr:aldehyde dehydrogenase family protein [Peribacillus frigoritolerans]